MGRLIALALLIPSALLTPAAAAHAASGIRIDQVTHGVELTLTVPRREYPRDALIQVTLTMTNVSPHTIYVHSGLQIPAADVLDSSGTEVYSPYQPLGDKTLLDPKGPGPQSFPLLSGHTWKEKQYLVLRGRYIEFQAWLGNVRRGKTLGVQTSAAIVRLTQQPAPQATIATSPSLHAIVTPAEPVSGPLLYFSQTSCSAGDVTQLTGGGWTPTGGTTIDSGLDVGPPPDSNCGSARWHVLAGWLNHPVIEIDYDQPAP